jgi:hypothetical protein
LVRLRFKLRALYLQSNPCTTWVTSPVHFAILEMESCKWFAWADLEPQSWAQLPK